MGATSGDDVYGQFLFTGGTTSNAAVIQDGSSTQSYASAIWLNDYTIEVVYDAYGTEGDGDGGAIRVARYLAIRTTDGGGAADTMTGDAIVDVMNGGAGNDTMDGAGGPDTMRGGIGSDLYYVDNGGDLVDEQSVTSDGYDTVYSYISYTLPNNVEALALIGGNPVNATGNALDNYLQGNGADNWLDGSFGADLMKGLGGNDSYVVDNKNDVVNEIDPGSGGWDTVYSAVDYKLGANLDALILLGTLKLDGSGNGGANYIQGNGKANVLKGSGGNDTVRGGGGKDVMDGGNGSHDAADYRDKTKAVSVTLDGSHTVTVKVDGKAEDKIKNFEDLFGGSKGDKFVGDSKANSFDGGFGKDVFTGKGGNDKFVFSTTLSPANLDTVTDFSHKHDKIVLGATEAFWFLGGTVEKAEFYAKGGAHKAHDADDRLIYNKSNGNLYIDVDGKDGAAAVLFAKIANHPGNFDHHDIIIV